MDRVAFCVPLAVFASPNNTSYFCVIPPKKDIFPYIRVLLLFLCALILTVYMYIRYARAYVFVRVCVCRTYYIIPIYIYIRICSVYIHVYVYLKISQSRRATVVAWETDDPTPDPTLHHLNEFRYTTALYTCRIYYYYAYMSAENINITLVQFAKNL